MSELDEFLGLFGTDLVSVERSAAHMDRLIRAITPHHPEDTPEPEPPDADGES